MRTARLVGVANVVCATRSAIAVVVHCLPPHKYVANPAETFAQMSKRVEVHLRDEREPGVVSIEWKVQVSVIVDAADHCESVLNLLLGDGLLDMRRRGLDDTVKSFTLVCGALVVEEIHVEVALGSTRAECERVLGRLRGRGFCRRKHGDGE